jgi:DNA-binding SARP family transcriptional activator
MSDPISPAVRFEVLGPLRAWRGDVGINLGPVQQRVVLAVLLLQQNRPAGREQVIDAVWGDTGPRCATNLLHRHVSGLRRVLEPGRQARTASGPLAWTDAGYLLTVPDGGLDLERFGCALTRARNARAAGDLQEAAAILHSALALWRGPVCDGLTSPFLDAQRDQLNERRMAVVEECIELDLAVGDRADLIAELRQLVTEYPLRERLHSLLMLALYRSGRRADALAAFQDVRHLLRDELGVDPAAPLQRLHQQILAADPELGSAPHAGLLSNGSSSMSQRLPLPAQLPHSMPGFSGRTAEIDWLNGLLPGDDSGAGGTVVITAIAGMAGVGKTALAIHWAHQIRDRFPDGQLYVNLRGFDPAGPAMEPAEAIRAFLDSFAVPPDRIPVDLDAQAALYRSLLAGRRVLIVLDNARDASQVRPLLPGTPSCLVVVTSRNQLLSLVAADGAHPLGVDLLSAEQSRRLLIRRLGETRVAAEPAAVNEIIDSCAGLPLALSIVSARASANSRRSLEELAEELRETRGGLDVLDGGDQRTDLRAVFYWSYRALSTSAARMFRLLGLHAGPEIGAAAAASLAGIPPARARALLAELASAHLVTGRNRGRFTFHDLLRIYARELAETHDSAEERGAAVGRVLDNYLCSACRADRLLRPNRGDAIAAVPATPLTKPEETGDHREALAWFTAEYQVLLAALRQAAELGFDVHVWQLAWALTSFFDRRGLWHDAAASQRAALEAACRLSDPHAQAISHGCLGLTSIHLSRYGDGRAHLLQALELYRQLGHDTGQAHAHRSLAWVLDRQGSYREALVHAQQAFELFRTARHRTGQARALNAVGWFRIQLGDHEKGLVHCQQALDLQTETADRVGQAESLDSMASAYHYLGRYREAVAHYEQALDLRSEFGNRHAVGNTLTRLGDTHLADGSPAAAAAAWQRALTILDELGHPEAWQVRESLEKLGETAFAS